MAGGYFLTLTPPPAGTRIAAAKGHAIVMWQSALEALGDLPQRALRDGVLVCDCVVVPVAVADGDFTWWGDDGTVRARGGIVGEPLTIAEVLGDGGEEAVARLRELGNARLGHHDRRATLRLWQSYLAVVAALSGVPLLDAPYALVGEFEQAHNLLLAELSGASDNVFHQREALLATAAALLLRRLHAINPELCGEAGISAALAVATEAVALLDQGQLGDHAWQTVKRGGVPVVYRRWFDDLAHLVVEPLTGFARRYAQVPPCFAPAPSVGAAAVLFGLWQSAIQHLRRWRVASA